MYCIQFLRIYLYIHSINSVTYSFIIHLFSALFNFILWWCQSQLIVDRATVLKKKLCVPVFMSQTLNCLVYSLKMSENVHPRKSVFQKSKIWIFNWIFLFSLFLDWPQGSLEDLRVIPDVTPKRVKIHIFAPNSSDSHSNFTLSRVNIFTRYCSESCHINNK